MNELIDPIDFLPSARTRLDGARQALYYDRHSQGNSNGKSLSREPNSVCFNHRYTPLWQVFEI